MDTRYRPTCLFWCILRRTNTCKTLTNRSPRVRMWLSVLKIRILGTRTRIRPTLALSRLTSVCSFYNSLLLSAHWSLLFSLERSVNAAKSFEVNWSSTMGSKILAFDFPGTVPLRTASWSWLAVYGLLLVIAIHVLRQQLPRKKSEPPVIFHWIPFIGNAISYGTDPCKFYKQCRKQVCCALSRAGADADLCFATYSMAISSLSYCLARR